MLGKRIMCLGLTSLFFVTNLNTLTPFQAKEVHKLKNEISEVAIGGASQNEKVIKTRILNSYCPTLFQIDAEELIKQKEIEKQEKIKLENERLRKAEEEKNNKGIPVRLLVTYYGNTASQCENNEGIMANGEKVHYGAIACSSEIPFGSKITMDKSGREFICKDRGNPKYICKLGENYYRVDIFIPRNEGESTHDYEKRVRAMGTDDVTAVLYQNNN